VQHKVVAVSTERSVGLGGVINCRGWCRVLQYISRWPTCDAIAFRYIRQAGEKHKSSRLRFVPGGIISKCPSGRCDDEVHAMLHEPRDEVQGKQHVEEHKAVRGPLQLLLAGQRCAEGR